MAKVEGTLTDTPTKVDESISTIAKADLVGPFRSYSPFNIYFLKNIGTLSILDVSCSLIISCGYFYYMLTNSDDLSNELSTAELDLLKAIKYYREKRFILNELPPFGIQLFAMHPSNTEVLRRVSLGFASVFLSASYLTLRRSNVTPFLAVICPLLLSQVPLFQSQSVSISVDMLQLAGLSITIYCWRSMKVYTSFSKKWMVHLILLSICLALSMATKFLSLFTMLWICLSALFEFWNIIGDIRLSSKFLIKYIATVTFFLAIFPTAIFTFLNLLQFRDWKIDSPEYSTYMSPTFQAYLRGPTEHTTNLYYGSVINIRHIESIGGYLHSHNYSYETGSEEQQVTLAQNQSDPNNDWVIEHEMSIFDIKTRDVSVQSNDKVRLRHRLTGKLLRASTAKPPVSEQEYTNEVSCTGDFDYAGDSDELWSILIVNGNPREVILPFYSILQLSNIGHPCSLISHNVRLPNWGFYEQEVLCLQPATYSRTLFMIDSVEFKNATDVQISSFTGYENESSVTYHFKLLLELLKTQYRYNYYVKNYELKLENLQEGWPYKTIGSKIVDSIWLASIASIFFFIISQTKFVLLWNPWYPKTTYSLNDSITQEFCLEALLGWVLHYYPFCKSPVANLDIILYLPAFYFGILIGIQLTNSFYKWRRFSIIPLLTYMTYIVYF